MVHVKVKTKLGMVASEPTETTNFNKPPKRTLQGARIDLLKRQKDN